MEDKLNQFQWNVLWTIAGLDYEPHGLAVKEALEEEYDSEVHHGRLYPTLDSLVDDGLLEKGEKDKRTNVYKITDTGTELLHKKQSWIEECAENLTV